MCGISGIINLDNQIADLSEIKTINNLILHRGPDGEGFSTYKHLALGHRRLSIIDLSDEGSQPMNYEDRYTIVFNGEIYNYIELRKELSINNYTFKSNTDTEVIMAAYDFWGMDCFNHFNGMWAFALLDKQQDKLILSRDRFGVKPCYYTFQKNKLIFGSEIKQLLPFFDTNIVNSEVLIDYLVPGFIEHNEKTFFNEIFKLKPSHNLVFNLGDNSYNIYQYFFLKEKMDKEEYSKYDFIGLFESSINLRLRSDVTVGTCLSGGLDSSSVASLASNLYQSETRFMAIHAKSSEGSTDESHFAKDVARHLNLDLKVIEPSKEDFENVIDEVIYTQEEPFGSLSAYMQYFVMQEARKNNCKVLLDGQGGDEILLGYERYYPAVILNNKILGAITSYFKCVSNSKISFFRMFGFLFYFTSFKLRKFLLLRKYAYIKSKYIHKVDFNLLEKNCNSYTNLFQLQKLEIESTQLPALLRFEDKNSMKHSIEARLPFLDYRFVQKCLNLPLYMKLNKGWTKYILRLAIDKYLPRNIVWRKNKKGFEAPTSEWKKIIDDDFLTVIQESKILSEILIKDCNFSKLDFIQKWKLYNIAKWEKIYNVSIVSD